MQERLLDTRLPSHVAPEATKRTFPARNRVPSVDDGADLLQEVEFKVELELRDVSYTVVTPKKRIEVLKQINARFSPGELVGMLGPSGAGKTSLLDVIRGNAPGKVTGTILVNGVSGSNALFNNSCFIPQDDVLLTGLTARETLMFAARLRLPSALTAKQRRARVGVLLQKLGLEECADTRVGSVDKRGLSGGQRKRVSIGLELLTNPSVLFVDEATSGLDSKMAMDVVRILSELAHRKHTVICTIHQPSFDILAEFDKVLMITQGEIVYLGSPDQCATHLSSNGFEVPKHSNPAELWIEEMQDREAIPKLKTLWRANPLPMSESQASVLSLQPNQNSNRGFAANVLSQTIILTHRALTDQFKDPKKYLATLVVKVFVSLIVSVVWFGQARHHTQKSIFPTQGVCFFACLNTTMDAIMQTASVVPVARTLMLREYRNGYYSLGPYYIATLLSFGVSQMINALFAAVPIYLLVGLVPSAIPFFIFVATLALMANIGVSFGLLVGAVANDFSQAQRMVAPCMIPMVIFSGYLIPYAQVT
eukprot:c19145_g1_i3.p1 GENE.c19145_g1_i3~~c19145_g1_i3.p1  ORF type:complete len:537 (+),score=140.57 c19145_g1_i3:11-1621(+)